MYMLERAEAYVVKTEQLKNRTCQTIRWKQVAMSEDIEALKGIKKDHMRIIDWETLELISDANNLYK